MRILVWAILACFVLSCSNSWAGEPKPAGQIYNVPVEVWNPNSDAPEKADAVLLLPSELDEQGTLTLLLHAQSNSNLLVMDRANAPDAIGFIFGDMDKCYVRIYQTTMYGNKAAQFTVDLPYDTVSTKVQERTLKFVDAAGEQLQGFTLKTAFLGSFGNFQKPMVPIPIDDNGVAKLTRVINPFELPKRPYICNHQTATL